MNTKFELDEAMGAKNIKYGRLYHLKLSKIVTLVKNVVSAIRNILLLYFQADSFKR